MTEETKRKATLRRVIDGDTVEVVLSNGFLRRAKSARVRLSGIDAPESTQKGGRESTKELMRLCGSPGAKLWLHQTDTDRYNRLVGTIWKRGGFIFIPGPEPKPDNSLNYKMVQSGQAEVYMMRGPDTKIYREAQQQAQERNRGIWKEQSSRQSPRDYRRQRREDAEEAEERGFLTLVGVLAVGALAVAGAAAYFYFNNGGRLELPWING